MIVSLLKGGLGNMMFQISAGASIAKELGVDFSYTYEGWNCCTQYKIDEYPETIFKNIRKIDSPPRGWSPMYFRENGLLYQPIPRSTELVLDGYFQTEEHFKANEDYIRDLFDVPIMEEYEDYTFIHIRRGDYLKYSDVHSLTLLWFPLSSSNSADKYSRTAANGTPMSLQSFYKMQK